MDLSILGVGALLLVLLLLDTRRGPPPRVYLFGDSLAQGLTTPLRALAARDGVPFEADSQVGSTTNAWLTRGPDGAAAFGATVAIVVLGTNDAAANEEHQKRFASHVRTVLTNLKARGITPIWVIPPPMPFSTSLVERALIESDARLVRTVGPLERYDRIHPTPGEFSRWATEIWASTAALR